MRPHRGKKTDGRRRALVCRLTAPCRSSGARGCKAVLSSFHERAACSWLVVLRAGVMRGNPPTAAVRRSRSRITLASKARLPDPPLLTRLHPPRTQASCSCGPRLQKRCWVRCGEPWRSPPRISPTTSDIVPGAVVRHPDDHPNPPHGTTRATDRETHLPTYTYSSTARS